MSGGIKLVIFDFDGVFTDGKIYVSKNGDEIKCYNGKDSYALKLLKSKGIKTGIITADNPTIINNCRHIISRVDMIEYNTYNKLDILYDWVDRLELDLEDVAYIGDDLPDIPCLEAVGFSGCPANANSKVKKVCDFISIKNGGDGAVREFVEEIIHRMIYEAV